MSKAKKILLAEVNRAIAPHLVLAFPPDYFDNALKQLDTLFTEQMKKVLPKSHSDLCNAILPEFMLDGETDNCNCGYEASLKRLEESRKELFDE